MQQKKESGGRGRGEPETERPSAALASINFRLGYCLRVLMVHVISEGPSTVSTQLSQRSRGRSCSCPKLWHVMWQQLLLTVNAQFALPPSLLADSPVVQPPMLYLYWKLGREQTKCLKKSVRVLEVRIAN